MAINMPEIKIDAPYGIQNWHPKNIKYLTIVLDICGTYSIV
jgi:hypothetical protein